MSFIETEASIRHEMINGKNVAIITPKCEVTLTNTQTKQEYNAQIARRQIDVFVSEAKS